MAHTPASRARDLQRLRSEEFDVVVIGGGITGAGAFLEAASRGYRVALIESGDFASGTSSASSKLIHGGLRYLRQGEVGLVYENLAERSLLLKNAPSLVSKLDFVIPIPKRVGALDFTLRLSYSAVLWGYDLTGGYRIRQFHRRVGASDVKFMLPRLEVESLASAFIYHDAWCDDVRLVLATLRAARRYGAVGLNYVQANAIVHGDDGRVSAVAVRGRYQGDTPDTTQEFEIRTKAVVNATGISAERFLTDKSFTIRPAKGVHIVFSQRKLPSKVAAVLPVPSDNRTIFLLPWGDYTYVGTTDTDLGEAKLATAIDDVDYLLNALNASLDIKLTHTDITGAWVGARPLVASTNSKTKLSERTKDLSRRHKIIVDRAGTISVIGGKLTTYRKMGADAIDALDTFYARRTRSVSSRLSLEEGGTHSPSFANDPHLAQRYGSVASRIPKYLDGRDPITSGSWTIQPGEISFMVEEESALSLTDILLRRIRVGILDQAAAKSLAPSVQTELSNKLNFTPEESKRSLDEFYETLRQEMPEMPG